MKYFYFPYNLGVISLYIYIYIYILIWKNTTQYRKFNRVIWVVKGRNKFGDTVERDGQEGTVLGWSQKERMKKELL